MQDTAVIPDHQIMLPPFMGIDVFRGCRPGNQIFHIGPPLFFGPADNVGRVRGGEIILSPVCGIGSDQHLLYRRHFLLVALRQF